MASNLLTVHFWVRPRYRHYYFGNYYDVAWNNRGLTPWHQFPRQRRHFDPLYAYYGRGRNNDYFNQLNVQFNVFVNQPNRRPPVRFRDQDRWVQDHRDFRSHDLLGNRFQNFVDASRQDRDGFQFVRLENQQRERVQQETVRLRELVNQRRDVERSIAQLDRLRDRDNDGGRAGNGPNGLLNGSRDGDGRPDRDRGDDPRIGELRDRIDDAANGPPGENPVTVGNQDREIRGRDRLKLGDTTRNERPERPGRDGNKADDAVGNGLTDGKIAIDNPSPGDGGNGRGDANDGDSRGAKGNTRDDLNAGPPNETVGSDTGRGDRGGNRNPQGEKTAGDVGTAIIAGESDANAKPPEQDRQGRRERLKLPPASNANENPASRNVRSRGNDNVSNGAQSLPSDGRNAGNGIDASKPSTGGIPDIGRDTPVPDNKKERSNLSNSNGNAEPQFVDAVRIDRRCSFQGQNHRRLELAEITLRVLVSQWVPSSRTQRLAITKVRRVPIPLRDCEIPAHRDDLQVSHLAANRLVVLRFQNGIHLPSSPHRELVPDRLRWDRSRWT